MLINTATSPLHPTKVTKRRAAVNMGPQKLPPNRNAMELNQPTRSSRRVRGLAPQSYVSPPKAIFLPPELKVDVLARLDKRDLKSVRLVSKEWSLLATGPLFDRVFFSCRGVDLEVWKNVTRHPVIGGVVREVVYDGSIFKADMDFEKYFRDVYFHIRGIARNWEHDTPFDSADIQINKFVEDCKEKKPVFSKLYKAHKMDKFLVEGYQNYGTYSAFERSCIDKGLIFNDLCMGLRSLTNLRSVVFNNSMWHYILHKNEYIGTTNPETLRGPYSGSPLCRSWNPFHLRPRGCDRARDVDDRQHYTLSYFDMLTQAISATDRKITSLQTGTDAIGGGLPQQALTRSNLTDYQFWHFMNAYSGLRCLDIDVITDKLDQREALTVLPMLLQQTFGLRKLSLYLNQGISRPHISKGPSTHYRYDEIFPPLGIWPELAELSIEGLAIGGWDLIKLISARARLRKLDLNGIDLLDGTWEGVIQGMHRRPRLTELTMRGRFTHCGGAVLRPSSPESNRTDSWFLSLVEDYVINGGRHPCLRPETVREIYSESVTESDWETSYRWYFDLMPEKELNDMELGAREIGLDIDKSFFNWS